MSISIRDKNNLTENLVIPEQKKQINAHLLQDYLLLQYDLYKIYLLNNTLLHNENKQTRSVGTQSEYVSHSIGIQSEKQNLSPKNESQDSCSTENSSVENDLKIFFEPNKKIRASYDDASLKKF